MKRSRPPGRSVGVAPEPSALYADNVQEIHRYVARRIGRDDAADVVAETFRTAIAGLASFDPSRGTERAWLFGIATNQLRRHWRTEQRRLRAMARTAGDARLLVDESALVDHRIDSADDAGRLLSAMSELGPDELALLTLIAWEECSYDEAARILDIPIGTVRSRLHRTRESLRVAMQADSHTKKVHEHG